MTLTNTQEPRGHYLQLPHKYWVNGWHRKLNLAGNTGGAARLPPAYVAAHVELGFALTAHGAHGMTVDEAHVLVGAGDPAALVYVGMTRGRQANHAHVVVDEAADEPGRLPAAGGAGRGPGRRAGQRRTGDRHRYRRVGDSGRERPAVLAARYLAVVDEDRRARVARGADASGRTC
ncbi:MAG: helicase C-terminal domain-containing protein [Actinomycetota bacterium]|nr:helicase C-terminal domain-containing protein [Actinomycetota bacterium]